LQAGHWEYLLLLAMGLKSLLGEYLGLTSKHFRKAKHHLLFLWGAIVLKAWRPSQKMTWVENLSWYDWSQRSLDFGPFQSTHKHENHPTEANVPNRITGLKAIPNSHISLPS
jgi:hypothetical protein